LHYKPKIEKIRYFFQTAVAGLEKAPFGRSYRLHKIAPKSRIKPLNELQQLLLEAAISRLGLT